MFVSEAGIDEARLFGVKKEKLPALTVEESSQRVRAALIWTVMDESACYLNWTLNFLEWSFEDLEGSSSLDLVFAGTRGFGIVRSKEVVVWGKQINTRSDTINEKIKKLDVEFSKRREQIKKARPGPTQEAIKARAMRILKHKKNVTASSYCLCLLSVARKGDSLVVKTYRGWV